MILKGKNNSDIKTGQTTILENRNLSHSEVCDELN